MGEREPGSARRQRHAREGARLKLVAWGEACGPALAPPALLLDRRAAGAAGCLASQGPAQPSHPQQAFCTSGNTVVRWLSQSLSEGSSPAEGGAGGAGGGSLWVGALLLPLSSRKPACCCCCWQQAAPAPAPCTRLLGAPQLAVQPAPLCAHPRAPAGGPPKSPGKICRPRCGTCPAEHGAVWEGVQHRVGGRARRRAVV